MSQFWVVLSFLVVICCTCFKLVTTKDISKKCGQRMSRFSSTTTVGDNYIFHGSRALPYEFPWQVSLQKSWSFPTPHQQQQQQKQQLQFLPVPGLPPRPFLDSNDDFHQFQHFCGGSIIGDKWIITAAHCVADVDKPNSLAVLMGTVNKSVSSISPHRIEQRLVPVKQIYLNNWNEETVENDIALLELSEPIGLDQPELEGRLSAICLARPEMMVEGRMAVISGWGKTETGDYPLMLHKGMVVVERQTDCEQLFRNNPDLLYVHKGQVCAGRTVSVCNEDSGGPLQFQSNNGQWYLLGITSWSLRCGDPDFPGVFARVPYYLNFIYNITGIK